MRHQIKSITSSNDIDDDDDDAVNTSDLSTSLAAINVDFLSNLKTRKRKTNDQASTTNSDNANAKQLKINTAELTPPNSCDVDLNHLNPTNKLSTQLIGSDSTIFGVNNECNMNICDVSSNAMLDSPFNNLQQNIIVPATAVYSNQQQFRNQESQQPSSTIITPASLQQQPTRFISPPTPTNSTSSSNQIGVNDDNVSVLQRIDKLIITDHQQTESRGPFFKIGLDAINTPTQNSEPTPPLTLDNKLQVTAAKIDRPLPNDTDIETLEQENLFFNSLDLKEYTVYTPSSRTVIYCRSKNKNYICNNNTHELMTDSTFGTYFTDVGHTLGINYKLSYVRYLAFDLDCICKVRPNLGMHLNDSEINKFILELANVIKLNLPHSNKSPKGKLNLKYTIYTNGCGAHVYTDIPVSLFLHEFLLSKLNPLINLNSSKYKAEIPKIMPLPFSAKVPRQPYTPYSMGDVGYILGEGVSYYEYVGFNTIPIASMDVNEDLNIHTTLATMVNCMERIKVVAKPRISLFVHVPKINKFDSLLTNIESFRLYTETIDLFRLNTTTTITKRCVDKDEITKQELHSVIDILGYVNFIEKFNYLFFGELKNEDVSKFVEFSAKDHGGLYLQHMVGALYLAVIHPNVKEVDDKFKLFLKMLFGSEYHTNKPLQRFIDRFNSLIMVAYKQYATSDYYILQYMANVHLNKIVPEMNTNMIIRRCMASNNEVQAALNELRSDTIKLDRKHELYKAIITSYFDICKKYNLVCVDCDSSNVKKQHYIMNSKNNQFLRIESNNDYTCLSDYLPESVIKNLQVPNSDELSDINFEPSTSMILTKVGIFNSITGLYVAALPLIRFDRLRDIVLWLPSKQQVIDYDMNEVLVDYYDAVEIVFKQFLNSYNSLTYYGVLLPALIQLRYYNKMDEIEALEFNNLFKIHDYEPEFEFIFDYYPIDPKFVYFIYYITCCYDVGGADQLPDVQLFRYNTLRDIIFTTYNNDCKTVSWYDKFSHVLNNVTYDVNAKKYSDKLKSLNDVDGKCKSICFWFEFWIKAVCLSNVDEFKELFDSLKVDPLPPIANTISEYGTGETMKTTTETMRNNMIYALNKVFDFPNLPDFAYIGYTLMQLCISNNFNKESTLDLINVSGMVYMTYNINKKIVVIYGVGNTGKSHYTNILSKMVEPSIHKTMKLEDAVDRSNITQFRHLSIIHEMGNVSIDTIKAITGNDNVSTKIFFRQNYVNSTRTQGLIFGATNNIISFQNNSRQEVLTDKTSVNRIHCIKLKGISSMERQGMHEMSLANMASKGKFFTEIFPQTIEYAPYALGWISYVSYVLTRGAKMEPYINVNSEDTLTYQEEVYKSNNKYYKFLTECGFQDCDSYITPKKTVISIITKYYEEKKQKLSKFNMQDLYNLIDKLYVTTTTTKSSSTTTAGQAYYNGIILTSHLKTFKNALETIPCADMSITRDELKARINCFVNDSGEDVKLNAFRYFKKNNDSYYNREKDAYVGVCFTIPTLEDISLPSSFTQPTQNMDIYPINEFSQTQY